MPTSKNKISLVGADDATFKLPEGEWHRVAILRVGLNFPPAADDEDVFENIMRAVSALMQIIQEQQGQVVRYQDGLMAIFGAPITYEDDVERAVQAAWKMLAFFTPPERHPFLSGRIVLSYGSIVAGYVETQFKREFVVTGEPIDIAQRMLTGVPSGDVWATQSIYEATQHVFIYEANSPKIAGMLPELVIFRLVGNQGVLIAPRGDSGFQAPFVGREAILESMNAFARNLNHNKGGVVWIEGEAGIGKSRLISEFIATASMRSAVILYGRCSPKKSSLAFALFFDFLNQAFDLQATDTPEQTRFKIRQFVKSGPPELLDTRPYLEILLGLPPDGGEVDVLSNLAPEQLQQQTFVAWRKFFRALASQHAMVVVLDDMHWVDPSSADLLLFILTVVSTSPILFVCAQRRREADIVTERLERLKTLIPEQTLHIDLPLLSHIECATLLNALLPETASTRPLQRVILERSEGNPYFIEEFLRMCIDRKYLERKSGQWELREGLELDTLSLPSSLETLIRSRIDILPADLKLVVQYAVVVGGPFDISLLKVLLKSMDVEAAFGKLAERLLLHRAAEVGHWKFTHAAVEKVVYNAMLKSRRRELHHQIAQALEYYWAGVQAEHAEELAHHFTQAEEAPKALTYLVWAGERALARYVNEAAIRYFEQALAMLTQFDQAPGHLQWDIAAGLGDAYCAVGRYEEAVKALQNGLTLSGALGFSLRDIAALQRRLGDTDRKQGEFEAAHEHYVVGQEKLKDADDAPALVEMARVQIGLAWVYFLQGRFDLALQVCLDSLAYARRIDALSELAAAENLLGGIYYRLGDLDLASEYTMQAMLSRERMGYTWGMASTLSNLGVLAVSGGQWNKAKSFFERSLALRQDMGDMEGVALTCNNLGLLTCDQGDLDVAESYFKQSLEIAEPFHINFHIVNSTVGLAQVYLLKMDFPAARKTVQSCLAQAEMINSYHVMAEVYRIQAELLLADKQCQQARETIKRALILTAEIGDRLLEVRAWRVASQIELQCGDLSAAKAALESAYSIVETAHDELAAGRLAVQDGKIMAYAGDRERAREEFLRARQIFVQLGAALDLQKADSAMQEVAS